jgi:hypothetical protein
MISTNCKHPCRKENNMIAIYHKCLL